MGEKDLIVPESEYSKPLFQNSVLEPEIQHAFVDEIRLKLGNLLGDVEVGLADSLENLIELVEDSTEEEREVYFTWSTRVPEQGSGLEYEFHSERTHFIGKTESDGPFDVSTACAIAYAAMEGWVLGRQILSPEIDEKLGVSSTRAYGEGMIMFIHQVSLWARENEEKAMREVVKKAKQRTLEMLEGDKAKAGEAYEQQIEFDRGNILKSRESHRFATLLAVGDKVKGAEKALLLLEEFRGFEWTGE